MSKYNEGGWNDPEYQGPVSPMKFINEDQIIVDRPELIDPISAYHNGLLDAVCNKPGLSSVLIVAEQRVLNDRYCEGYAAGNNLMGRLSYQELEAIVQGKIDKLNRERRNKK